MTPIEPWELGVAWLGLGVLLASTLPAGGLLLPVLALCPWLFGAILLLRRRSAKAAASTATRQLRDRGGRITLLVTGVLVAVVALAANLFLAFLLLAWTAAAGLLLLLLVGPDRFSAFWQRTVTATAAAVVACAVVEGVLRLPFLAERYGPPLGGWLALDQAGQHLLRVPRRGRRPCRDARASVTRTVLAGGRRPEAGFMTGRPWPSTAAGGSGWWRGP